MIETVARKISGRITTSRFSCGCCGCDWSGVVEGFGIVSVLVEVASNDVVME